MRCWTYSKFLGNLLKSTHQPRREQNTATNESSSIIENKSFLQDYLLSVVPAGTEKNYGFVWEKTEGKMTGDVSKSLPAVG